MAVKSKRWFIIWSIGLMAALPVFLVQSTNGDTGTRVALSMTRDAEDIDFLVDEEFHYFCYFSAYTFGPTLKENPYFKSDFVKLNQSVAEGYADEFPLRDGIALLFLFDKDQRLQVALTLRERRGYLRWKVRYGAELQEFCASIDDVAIQTKASGSFVLLEFEN